MRSTVEYRRPSLARLRAKRFLNLLEVMAIAMATFVLVPMAVQADPGGDFEVQIEEPGGIETVHCQFTGQDVLLEETVYCRLRVGNGSSVDGSFFLYVDEGSYKVTRCPDQGTATMSDDFDPQTGDCIGGPGTRIEVDPSEEDFHTFVGFWAMSLESQPVFVRSLPEDRDIAYDPRFVETCPKQELHAYNGGIGHTDHTRMCDMGLIRAIGADAFNDFNEPVYERQYYIGMTLRDDGTNQTRFRGWDLEFDFVVQMKVPANDPCPEGRVNGMCPIPVYERR